MIYVQLFLNFLMIGALSFGGGYGMISLVRETVLSHGWLTESDFLSFIAVSESTPGPLAVNMATFIGSSQGGLLGAFFATLGVVLPSFVIILLIAAVLQNLMKYAGVEAFLSGVRPCVVAMILATALTMALSTLAGFTTVGGGVSVSARSAAVFALLWTVHFAYKKVIKKASCSGASDPFGRSVNKKTECRPTGESLQGGIPLFATGQDQNLGGSGRSSHRGSSLAGSCLRGCCLRRCSFRGCGFAGSCLRGSRDRSNGRSRRLCGRRSSSGRRAAAGSHTNSQNQSSNDNSNILEFHIPKSPYDPKNSQPTPHRRDRSAK